MKKFSWNESYNVIALYAFLVIALSMLFGVFIFNFSSVLGFLQTIMTFLVPFIYAFGIAFILSPAVKFFERNLKIKKMSDKAKRNFAILMTYTITLLLIVLFFVIVAPGIGNSIAQLAKNLSTYGENINGLVNSLTDLIPKQYIPQKVLNFIDNLLAQATSFLSASLMSLVGFTTRLTSGVINFVMGIIVSIYMLADKERLIAQFKKTSYALFPNKFVDLMIETAHDGNKKFTGFIVGKIIDSAIIGILCAIGMLIFRMPFVSFVSIIIGVTNIIPYFGPFIGAIPGTLIVLVAGGWGQAIGFLVFVLLLQQFDGNILGPAILGQSTGLSAMWVIFAILLFGGLYGFVGMIIGVPLLSVIFELIGRYINYRLRKKNLSTDENDYASQQHKLLDSDNKK